MIGRELDSRTKQNAEELQSDTGMVPGIAPVKLAGFGSGCEYKSHPITERIAPLPEQKT